LRAALHQRFVTLLFGLALAAAGLWAFRQLKIEAYPDISDTQVVVITLLPGRAAEEVEQQVTIPIERALNSVPAVIARRSRTIFGLSVVELTFDYGTDDYFARQVVLEKLRDADLPEDAAPSLGPLSTPIGELYRYSLSGKNYTSAQLREIQDWVIAPRFLQVPGVADVTPFGGLVKQYQVEVDPLALSKYNLSISQVVESINTNNQNAGGGLVDNRQQSMVVRGVGRVGSIADIEGIIVNESSGVPIFVRDIGRVRIGAAIPTGTFGLDRETGGVEGFVLMRRGENPSEVLVAIKNAVADLQGRLPQGVEITPIYDRTDLVDNTLHTVSHTLLEGLGIVMIVLVVFLGSLRAAVLTAITIPFSLLFAFICMHFSNIPANLLSLGALDFGIIVDATLVMVEHILHKIDEIGDSGIPIFEAILQAALEMERPIFFSLAIIIAAYIPLFTLERVERKLFTPMAFTICYALAGSLLLALTFVPVVATYLFRNGNNAWRNPVLESLPRWYRSILHRAMAKPLATLSAAGALVLASFGIAATLGIEFLPNLDEGLILIRMVLPPGISLEESARVATHARGVIQQYPEVLHCASQSGRNDSGTDPYGPNRNEILIALHPYNTWPSGMNKKKLVEELSTKLNQEIPGAAFSFAQPILDNVTEAVTGSAADLAIIISGPDFKVLRENASQALELIKTIPGAADSSIEQEADQPQLRISVRRDRIARYGINIRTVVDVISMAIGGHPAGEFFENERRFDIAVRYIPEARSDITAIGAILIPTLEGGHVSLGQVADIQVVNGATIIARRDNRRQITVRTNIRGRDQGGFAAEAQKLFARKIPLPPGYTVSWGGQFENLERAQRRLKLILPATLVIIFGLLFMMFGSARYAGIVMMNVPFSLLGGFVFLKLRSINLSVSAAVGFISLFGVAVMSGVLVVSEINRRRRRDPEVPLREAILNGACAQLRPVLLMITVAMLGMVPAALASGIGSDVQRPLATVVLGGLLSTLVLTLLALPSLYYVASRPDSRRSA